MVKWKKFGFFQENKEYFINLLMINYKRPSDPQYGFAFFSFSFFEFLFNIFTDTVKRMLYKLLILQTQWNLFFLARLNFDFENFEKNELTAFQNAHQ